MHTIAYFRSFVQGARKICAEMGLFSNALGLQGVDSCQLCPQFRAMIPNIWQNHNFRRLFGATCLTNLGDGLLAVAVPWLATTLTQNPVIIGLVAAMREVPWLLFALPAGVVTDCFDHRRLLMACDAARIVLVLALAALAYTATPHAASIALLLALTFALGAIEVLRDNTGQSFLPAVVEKEQLEQANGLLWGAEHATGQFIGPPLAGVLIGVALAAPFGVQAALLAGAVAMMGRLALPRMAAKPRQPFGPALREGVVWLWRHPILRRLAITLGIYNFIGSLFWAVLVLYGQRVLGLNAAQYGSLLAATAVGGLLGSVLGPAVLRRLPAGAGLFVGLIGFITAALILALSSSVIVVAAALMAEAFCNMLWNLTTVSYRQRHIPAPLMGRVNAAYRFFGTGPAAFGSVTAGLLVAAASGLGPEAALRLPYALAAFGAGLILLYAAFRLRLE